MLDASSRDRLDCCDSLKQFPQLNYTSSILLMISDGIYLSDTNLTILQPIIVSYSQSLLFSVPDAPADIKATSVTGDTVILSWKQPVRRRGEVLSFTLYKQLERRVSTLTVPGTERQFTFKGRWDRAVRLTDDGCRSGVWRVV